MDLESLKQECKEEMFIYTDEFLKLIEIIEGQQKRINELEKILKVFSKPTKNKFKNMTSKDIRESMEGRDGSWFED